MRNGSAIAIAVIVLAVTTAVVVARGRTPANGSRENATVGLVHGPVRDVAAQPFSSTPDPVVTAYAMMPAIDAKVMEGVTLVRPRFQRAGYGSKAMLSFVVQNRNDFPVKDVAMRCEFAGRDGRFKTARMRTLPDVVTTKGRKRFGPTLMGFVGGTYTQARCAIVNAARVDV